MRGASSEAEERARGRLTAILLAVVVAAALVLRLGAVLYFHSLKTLSIGARVLHDPAREVLFPDSLEYLLTATNILEGRGPMVDVASSIGRMPGYPYFLVLVDKLFGRSFLALRVVHALAGAAAAWLAFLVAREIYGRGEGVVAGALVAVYPFFILLTILVLAETLFITLLLGGLLCLLKGFRGEGAGWAVAAGVVLGAATLVRASLLLFLPLAAVAWVLARRFRKEAVLRAALMLVCFAAMMAPWVLRNWRVSGGHLVLTTLRSGASLYEGLNPEADGGPMMERINWGSGTAGLTEYQRDKLWEQRATDFARTHPGRVVALAFQKLSRFWNPMPNDPAFRVGLLSVALGLPYVVVVLLGIAGLAASFRRGEALLILVLPILYYSCMHMIFVSSIRYRVVIMPLVMALAAHGAVALWSRAQRLVVGSTLSGSS